MTIFIRRGSTVTPSHDGDIKVMNKLAAGVYKIGLNIAGLFLQDWTFEPHNGKVYGDAPQRVERIFTTYTSRPSSMGILLSGNKGSGKSTLIRLIAEESISRGTPVIIVDNQVTDDLTPMIDFIQSLGEVVVILDEFEKTFSDQSGFLPLLDGLSSDKKMFVVAVNDLWRVNDFMINRPGRMLYHFRYEGLEDEFVREYAIDTLKEQRYVDELVALNQSISLNFDSLKAIVDEMNRYGEPPKSALRYLNVSVNNDNNTTYTIIKLVDKATDRLIKIRDNYTLDRHDFSGDPTTSGFDISTLDEEHGYIEIRPNSLKSIKNQIMTYDDGSFVVTVRRQTKPAFSWIDAF